MSRGFTGTTRKPRCSHHSGNIQHPQGQKRPGKCGATSKWCWPSSLTPVGWCITNTHHKVKTLTKNTTWKSFVTFMMLCGARDQSYGQQKCGSCIMTMHQLIPRNWFKLSWPNTTFLWFNRLPTFLTWLCDYWLFPALKTQLKGTRFESWDDIIRNTTAKLYSIRKEAFQKCFEQLWNRWEKCVQSQGDYFEGD